MDAIDSDNRSIVFRIFSRFFFSEAGEFASQQSASKVRPLPSTVRVKQLASFGWSSGIGSSRFDSKTVSQAKAMPRGNLYPLWKPSTKPIRRRTRRKIVALIVIAERKPTENWDWDWEGLGGGRFIFGRRFHIGNLASGEISIARSRSRSRSRASRRRTHYDNLRLSNEYSLPFRATSGRRKDQRLWTQRYIVSIQSRTNNESFLKLSWSSLSPESSPRGNGSIHIRLSWNRCFQSERMWLRKHRKLWSV
jgi:hypothetical protein